MGRLLAAARSRYGIRDDIYLPADYTIVGPRARVNVRLYEFRDLASADEFVTAFEDDIVSSGVTDVAAVPGAPTFAENSMTYTYQTDWWSDIDPEYRIAAAMRRGETVAIVELAAAVPIPMDVFTGVAAAQEACLVQGCAKLDHSRPGLDAGDARHHSRRGRDDHPGSIGRIDAGAPATI